MEKIKDTTHFKNEMVTQEATESQDELRDWLDILKSVFSELFVLPTVHAIPGELPPIKPDPTPPDKLPIYDSPQSKYNEYVKSKQYECAKLSLNLHESLQPIVRSARIGVQNSYSSGKRTLQEGLGSAEKTMDETIDRTVNFLRKEDNVNLRKALVGIGVAAGYAFSIRNGVTLKIINTTIGATAMGALCFPKETDQLVRKTAIFGKDTFGDFYYAVYGKRFFKEERKCHETEPEEGPK